MTDTTTTAIIFAFVFTLLYWTFDKLERTLIEYNYEKQMKNRLYIRKGEYIQLTDSEIEIIKYKVSDSAKELIEAAQNAKTVRDIFDDDAF